MRARFDSPALVAGSSAIDSKTKALLIAQAAIDKHAEAVSVLDLRSLSNVTDFFVIATAGSSPHIKALRDYIEELLAGQGKRVWHTEGATAGLSKAAPGELQPSWILMDCADVVVHLLDPQARVFYRLEELWADAPQLPVPAS